MKFGIYSVIDIFGGKN